MKKIVMSLIVLGVLLGNAHQAKAEKPITKMIDTFNVVEDTTDNSVTCEPNLGMLVPFPCLLVEYGGTENAMSEEMGLDPNEVIGGSRNMTLVYNGGDVFGPQANVLIDPYAETARIGLTFTNDDDVFSTANVKWGGESMGMPDFDMSSDENRLAYYDEFVLGAYNVDIPTTVTIEVTNLNDETVQLAKVVGPVANETEDIVFKFSDPGWVGNRGIFGQKIKSISLILSGNDNFDSNFDYIYLRKIIPEPSLVWGTVIALGTGMISTYKRRKPF